MKSLRSRLGAIQKLQPPNIVKGCYVRQCLLVLIIVLDFFKCLRFHMHFISLYGALSLCARAQLISQRVDAGQLNVPPQQRPIILSLTRVMPN